MSGHQKFLAMGCLACRGKIGAEVTTRQIQEQWPNSQIAQKYNPVFYERAQQKGWVDPVLAKKGAFTVDQAGLDHLSALLRVDSEIVSADLQKSGGLVVVNRKATHTFDSICGRFSCAKSEILIADAWVDETIFDTVLDVIPRTVVIKLLYDRAQGTFAARVLRFSTQYSQFACKRYGDLHDRFMVDNSGFVLGPSIKDAASNSPHWWCSLTPARSVCCGTFSMSCGKKENENIACSKAQAAVLK
jgi:hypothetical protein